MSDVPSEKWRDPLICLGLVVVALFAYWEVQDNQFVNYDDNSAVTENPYVLQGLTRDNLVVALTDVAWHQLWAPLDWLSQMAVVELFGLNPRFHHLANLLLHLASTACLFLALKRLTGCRWPSAFVAAMFGVHPINVEPVAWIASRKDVLSAFFFILTLLAYGWYAAKPKISRYMCVALALAGGLASKSMVVTTPCVLLLLDFWPLNRTGGQLSFRKKDLKRYGWLVLEKLPLFLMAAGVIVLAMVANASGPGAKGQEVFPLRVRLANGALTHVEYLLRLLWPSGYSVHYPLDPAAISYGKAWLAGLLLVGITALAFWQMKRRPYVLVGWLWFLGMLAPVNGLVQQVGATFRMALKYMYLPSIGLFVIVAWGASDLTRTWRHRRLVLGLAAAALVASLSVCTMFEVLHWRNSKTLMMHALRATPESYVAHNCLAQVLLAEGNLDEAEYHYREALRIRPNNRSSVSNYGLLLLLQGKYGEAETWYRRLIQRSPNFGTAYYNLAQALKGQGKFAEAIAACRMAVEKEADPRDAKSLLQELEALRTGAGPKGPSRGGEVLRGGAGHGAEFAPSARQEEDS